MSRHIVGKVYDLTQESMNKLIAQLETEQARVKELEIALETMFDVVEQDHASMVSKCYMVWHGLDIKNKFINEEGEE